MSPKPALLAIALLAGACLRAESSDYPLAINLPTGERMQFWDIGAVFTHRFVTPVQGHSKDLYGLDGYAYPAFGFAFGIKPVKGLNALVYRSADNKTLVFALQERVYNGDRVRLTLRGERFDETVQKTVSALGTVGISGGVVQVPAEWFVTDDIIVTLVPTWISRTTTQDKAVFNVGAGLHLPLTGKMSFVGEYYPRPGKVDKSFSSGFAAGLAYQTLKHRFTLVGTNVVGTTANQVLSGDYGGGPRSSGKWSLGFNLVRVF